MKNFRSIVIRAALFLIILLTVLSIYGAFLGPERAKEFFNSPPLSIYWASLTILLAIGLAAFPRLVRVPGLLLMHSGCILVLVGSMWGSQAGHKFQKQICGIDKIPSGYMTIFEGQSQNLVTLENSNQMKKLPFHIELRDFRLEHYKPEYLYAQALSGQSWEFPVETGTEFNLGEDFGTVTILRTFENFKITIDEDKRTIIDSSGSGYNPALQVRLKFPDGTVKERYVFERYPGHIRPEDKFILNYRRAVKDYISDLKIIKDDDTIAEKSIEVNHPLHFGGYHFYQNSYDAEAGQYTVLMVSSDSGLNLVYTGYLMLGCGAFWHFWLRHPLKK